MDRLDTSSAPHNIAGTWLISKQ